MSKLTRGPSPQGNVIQPLGNEILTQTTWMNAENVPSEGSQTQTTTLYDPNYFKVQIRESVDRSVVPKDWEGDS